MIDISETSRISISSDVPCTLSVKKRTTLRLRTIILTSANVRKRSNPPAKYPRTLYELTTWREGMQLDLIPRIVYEILRRGSCARVTRRRKPRNRRHKQSRRYPGTESLYNHVIYYLLTELSRSTFSKLQPLRSSIAPASISSPCLLTRKITTTGTTIPKERNEGYNVPVTSADERKVRTSMPFKVIVLTFLFLQFDVSSQPSTIPIPLIIPIPPRRRRSDAGKQMFQLYCVQL